MLFLLATQLPPPAPTPAYPLEGAVREKYTALSVSAPASGVLQSVWEFRRADAGFTCALDGGCPAPKTSAPFETWSPSQLPDGRWCFRARFENDAGSSPFSPDRCWLEDRTDPPPPFYVDAGLGPDGMLVMHYRAVADPLSGPDRFCAAATSATDGYSPYCSTGAPWNQPGSLLEGVLRLPVPPGTWSGAVYAFDNAGNASTWTVGQTFTVSAVGPMPPPPVYRLPDGGIAPDDVWTNDTYLSRAVFPGTPTMRFSMLEVANEGSPFHVVTAIGAQNSGSSMFQRNDVNRKLIRYSVLDLDGGVSPHSAVIRVRFDSLAPLAPTNCTTFPSTMTSTVVTFDAGADAVSAVSFSITATGLDGGARVEGPFAGPAEVTLPEGRWSLSVVARDEAQNTSAAVPCAPPVIVDLTGPHCPVPALTFDGGAVSLSATCSDALSAVASVEYYRYSQAGGYVQVNAVDAPPQGTWEYAAKARDTLGNLGMLSLHTAPITVAPAAVEDAGSAGDGGAMVADAGVEPVDGGSPAPVAYDLRFSIGCSSVGGAPAWLMPAAVFLARWTRRRRRP